MGSASDTDERIFQIKMTLNDIRSRRSGDTSSFPQGFDSIVSTTGSRPRWGWLDYHMHVFSTEAGGYVQRNRSWIVEMSAGSLSLGF